MGFSFVPTSSSRPVNAFLLQSLSGDGRKHWMIGRAKGSSFVPIPIRIHSILNLRSALLISHSLCSELSAVHRSELSKAAKRSISLTQPYQIRRGCHALPCIVGKEKNEASEAVLHPPSNQTISSIHPEPASMVH